MDHQGLPSVDLYLLAEPDSAVATLLAALEQLGARRAPACPALPASDEEETITIPVLAAGLRQVDKA